MKVLLISVLLLLGLTACAQKPPDDGMGDLWKAIRTHSSQ